MDIRRNVAVTARWVVAVGITAASATAGPSSMQKLGARVYASDEETRYEAARAIDGDPATLWHSAFGARATRHPHWLQLEFPEPIRIRGFTALPRRDGQSNGWICDYALYASGDGRSWSQPVSRGTFRRTDELKTVLFDQPVTAKFFMLVALSGFVAGHASLAEFAVLEAERAAEAPRDPRAVRTHALNIDGRSAGRTFDGVGAVSAGGSTRLLVDYPEPERSQILDYLFKPSYGAALQLLKVEIGADTDATCGAEPSHMRVPDKIESNLGYEWWLMKEAKARNPEIALCALAWGAPGWIKGGFWSDDNIRYTIAWLDCARDHGLTIDYLGGGNERGFDAQYYIKLRQALDAHGYRGIKLVAADDHTPRDYWQVAREMKANRDFAQAVDVLSAHDFCVWRTQQRHCYVSDDARGLGKPIWDSENSTQDYKIGGEPLARAMNRHYIEGGVTGNFNWSLVGAYYGSLPAPGTGLLLADRPWSGWYDLGKSVWVDAHTTQFTRRGWRYLDSACGYTAGGSSFVTLRSADTGAYTTVIETMDLAAPERLEITVRGGLSESDVHVWSTDLRSDADADHFVHLRTIRPEGGRYGVALEPGRVYTLSTLTGQHKGDARPKARASQRMPLPYREDFEKTGEDRLAAYFSDVHGGFEAAPAGGGRTGHAYRQMLTQEPILWHGAKMPPTTVLGDPLWWGDYEVSVDALLEEPGYIELLGRLEHLPHAMEGYHLQVSDAGAWSVYTEDGKARKTTLASGNAPAIGLNTWHRVALRFVGDRITALLDGRELTTLRDDAHAGGQVGLRVSAWQRAQFDNFAVSSTAPWPKFVPHEEMRATATSEHAENDFGSVYLGRNAIDDRVETSWRSEYAPPAPLPQSITLDLGRARTISGLVYRPPADPAAGAILHYDVQTSADGRTFARVVAGEWKPTQAAKTVTWPALRARFVRLEAVKAAGDRGAAAREIEVIEK